MKNYNILVFTDKEFDAYRLVDRDSTQRTVYTERHSGHNHRYQWVNTIYSNSAFSTTIRNNNGVKIVYKWRDNGFDIEQIKQADAIIKDNFVTMRSLKELLRTFEIDKLVLVV